jgi:hypothetical protein
MFVYLPHKNANHTMHISPAADPRMKGEMPTEWVDGDNSPLTFQVEFVRGKAEVDDKIGKYMTDMGLAKKSKIILPDED